MPQFFTSQPTLRAALSGADLNGRQLLAAHAAISFGDIVAGWSLSLDRRALAGCSAVIVTDEQLAAGLALLDLDGVARRMVVVPADLRPEHLASIVADAEIDTIVTDRDPASFADLKVARVVRCRLPALDSETAPHAPRSTEWVLLTSGTTGVPKMVVHSLSALVAAIGAAPTTAKPIVWATFYDIRRYGGLQIFLRAVMGARSLVLSKADEPVADHLGRLATSGVTHISGTPSHWRRALMCASAGAIAPDYVRLSGEVADQAILNALHAAYPAARIGHAYASTEAGVGFAVDDGLEGFPASLLDGSRSQVQMKVADGSLRVRSSGAASRYLGRAVEPLTDADGYIDTGDMVELRQGRFYFVGRRGGIINVGGLKVHPEEVEAVINRHRGVRMSLVKARRSPIIGAIVVADVVLDEETSAHANSAGQILKDEIIRFCRSALPQHKVPAAVRFVPALTMTTAGKLERDHA
jgi:acyl-coenzyme A synthetase/AMP-(fatty) acid ligase